MRIAFTFAGILGEIIKAFTGGDVNHAMLVYEDPTFGLTMTLGANANGLTLVPLTHVRDMEIKHIYRPRDGQPSLIAGVRALSHLIDTPYDYAGLLGMSIVEAERRWFKHAINNPLLDKHKLFCSEYAKMVAWHSGYFILPNVEPGACDPAQLSAALAKFPQFEEVAIPTIS